MESAQKKQVTHDNNPQVPITVVNDEPTSFPIDMPENIKEAIVKKNASSIREDFLNAIPGYLTDINKLEDDDEQEKTKKPSDSVKFTHCLQCGQIPEKIFWCGGCGCECYCSKECQTSRWDVSHKHQCKAMKLVKPDKSDLYVCNLANPNPITGKHLVAKQDIKAGQVILTDVPLAFSLGKFVTIDKLEKPQRDALMGNVSESVFKEYNNIYTNSTMTDDIQKFENPKTLAANLTEHLIKTHPWLLKDTFFQVMILDIKNDGEAGSDTDIITRLYSSYLAGFDSSKCAKPCDVRDLSLLWGKVRVNGYTVATMFPDTAIGYGFFPKMSMINHACNPNAMYFFSSGTMKVYAVRDIQKGDEINVDYTCGYAPIMSRVRRQFFINETCFFTCKCKYCRSAQDIVPSTWEIDKIGGSNFKWRKYIDSRSLSATLEILDDLRGKTDLHSPRLVEPVVANTFHMIEFAGLLLLTKEACVRYCLFNFY